MRRCVGAVIVSLPRWTLPSQDGHTTQAVPRDNVVFEAGYFIRAKGKDRVLIVREAGAKTPADLGGTSTPRSTSARSWAASTSR
jgi:hypothetical protein